MLLLLLLLLLLLGGGLAWAARALASLLGRGAALQAIRLCHGKGAGLGLALHAQTQDFASMVVRVRYMHAHTPTTKVHRPCFGFGTRASGCVKRTP